MDIDPDLLADNPNSTMDIETILAHDMVPEGLPAPNEGPTEHQV
jgi:hypothetical protein